MTTGCFTWQSSLLSFASTGFVPQSGRAVSIAHIHHSHPCTLTRVQVSQPLTMWVARDEPPSMGCVCLHTSELCWLCYLIPWMELQGESQSELSLCVIHLIYKSAICRERESFDIQKSIVVKGKTAWQRQTGHKTMTVFATSPWKLIASFYNMD